MRDALDTNMYTMLMIHDYVGRGDPNAIGKYYELVLGIIRVVTCCILSKGPQNEQMIKLGRKFLDETKNVAMTVFKRHANIGGVKRESVSREFKELTELFVLLMSLTGYIEVRFPLKDVGCKANGGFILRPGREL